MRKAFFLLIALSFVGIKAFSQKSTINSLISTAQFSDSLQTAKVLILLDVRTPEEFNAGHVKGALNYDFKNVDFKRKIAELDTAKTYYVYCRSGARSAMAVKEMRSQGFNNIYEMEGGMLKWVADGMQTVKEVQE